MNPLEPAPPSRAQAVAALPSLFAGVSLGSAAATAVLWLGGAVGDGASTALLALGLVSWGSAGALAVLGGAVSGIQLIRPGPRSRGLPLTAAILAGLVMLGAMVLPVGVAAGAVMMPAPASLSQVAVPLTAPWTAMNLATGPGTVLYSDPYSVTIVDTSGASALAAAGVYDAQVRAAGWTPTFVDRSNGFYAGTYAKGADTLTLATATSAGMTTITLVLQ
jgi:hypothetical protein